MIRENNGIFYLETEKTEYIFRITQKGYLEHIYYGKRLNDDDITPYTDRNTFIYGNCVEYEDNDRIITAEHFKSEFSQPGRGDVREISVDIIHCDGTRTSDFLYKSYSVENNKYIIDTLPCAYAGEYGVMSLSINMEDALTKDELILNYAVYEESDVITKNVVFTNKESGAVTVRKLMSNQLDFENGSYKMINFNGGWADEMNMSERKILPGITSGASFCGSSSSRTNPFIMVADDKAGEDYGDVYAFNLVYSGNHYESVYCDTAGAVRFIHGINPSETEFKIWPGEKFEAPESVMCYSFSGYEGVSRNMHYFIQNNIVRGYWKNKVRPIVINSWESYYFDINEDKLLKLAKSAAKCKMEVLVIDDGWFKGRNDDCTSLGDWESDETKFPEGLESLTKKIRELGMDVGIWIEPEMISEKSTLYEKHPDWAVKIPNRNHAYGRHQLILDMTNEEVQEYVIKAVCRVIESCQASYVKWDMNRVMSDYYGVKCLKNQLEFAHRYIMGVYKVMEKVTSAFPQVLFESCAGGGNRFDLGMLCYMPQIWASDNTDAGCRLNIQEGYSYGYPSSVISAHVSQCPNHQTGRVISLYTRFCVAAFGITGFECNFDNCTPKELKAFEEMVEFYKQYRKYIQFGQFYRLKNDEKENAWQLFDERTQKGIFMLYRKDTAFKGVYSKIKLKGLKADAKYKISGDIQCITTGNVLMNAGFAVPENGTEHGFMMENETKLYTIEKI